MKFPWKIVKRTHTRSDEKIEQIIKLLFPPLELREQTKDGRTIKFHVDHSVDSNLDAVLIDLQDGYNDEVAHKTINNVIKKLSEVRRMLHAYSEFDENAEYLIVDDDDKNDLGKIETSEI